MKSKKEKEQYRKDLIDFISKRLKNLHKEESPVFYRVWDDNFGDEFEHYKNPFHPNVLNAWFTDAGLENICTQMMSHWSNHNEGLKGWERTKLVSSWIYKNNN